MRKSIKKLITITLAIFINILSINSFAAVVGNADGANFITKDQFEELKSSFNAQIENYNMSIDNKIDGSIASYLRGRIPDKTQDKILTNEWEEVSFLRDSIAPEWGYPDMTYLQNCFLYYAYGETDTKCVSLYYKWKYEKTNWGSDETLYRPLVTTNKTESNFDKVYWNGIANRYKETLIHTQACSANFTNLRNLEQSLSYGHVIIKNPLKQNQSGYDRDFQTSTTYINPVFFYEYRSSTSGAFSGGIDGTVGRNKSTNSARVDLVKVNNKTKNREHVVMYDEDTEWVVSNENFTRTHRTHSSNILTPANWWSLGTKNNYTYVLTHRSTSDSSAYGSMDFDVNNESGTLSSTGLLGDYKSKNIYQFNDKLTSTYGQDSKTLEDVPLSAGLPLHLVRADSFSEWSFEFSSVVNWDGTDYEENQREVDLYFSYGPFKSGLQTDNPAYIAKDKNGNQVNYVTTTDRKGKISFDSLEDEILYVKCVPHWNPSETSYINEQWECVLDVSKSSTFSYID